MNWINFFEQYPKHLRNALSALSNERSETLYFSGGAVRDWLKAKEPVDLDITVGKNALGCAQWLSKKLHATYVPLSEEEGVARVVWNDFCVDFSEFRDGTRSIEHDLQLRDFTINSMAIPFTWQNFSSEGELIDPLNGHGDLQQKVIRHNSQEVFKSDPLRMLRAYRLSASHDFRIAPQTKSLIKKQAHLIERTAGERVNYELDHIFRTDQSCQVLMQMAESELLWVLYPEVAAGLNVDQPSSHHLDVAGHCLDCLCQMEKLIRNPSKFFNNYHPEIKEYLDQTKIQVLLKKAALLHDIGKANTQSFNGQRFTFYRHDVVGAEQIAVIAQRQKWSLADKRNVNLLVKHHMRPFHLNNSKKKTGITAKASLKLVKAVNDHLIGLFMLAMADSMASCGVGRPKSMEQDLANLFDEVFSFYLQKIIPVLTNPLLSGHDLINHFSLKPGPIFGQVLRELEATRVSNPEMDKQEALSWVADYLQNRQ